MNPTVGALDALGDTTIDARLKGVPLGAKLALRDVGQQKWNVARGDLALPVTTLYESALSNNLAAMAAYCARHGALLAPHAKTTMAPQLMRRQIDAGAWALSVATPSQAAVLRHYGFARIILANELVDPRALRWLAGEMESDPAFEFYCLVDSNVALATIDSALEGVLHRRRLPVLVEVGVEGGRGGVRQASHALEIAKSVAASRHLELAGVELYEGLVSNNATPEDLIAVDELCRYGRDVVDSLAHSRLFRPGPVLLSAGGSAYFDRVVAGLTHDDGAAVQLVLRSGCYLTHDRGGYERVSPLDGRAGPLEELTLRNALVGWAAVLSQPEPGVAIVGAGKRDLPYDAGLPVPRWRYPRGGAARENLYGRATVVRLMDQHAFVHFDPDVTLEPGDIVTFDLSHPCTAFDKCRLVPILDDDETVIDAVLTFF